ncbi:hypothetical protein C0989_001687 [Termitomyces sp. Mn162]|nr:hypothetical protein C0989_001687 [Termitomyces sp. Mn162]
MFRTRSLIPSLLKTNSLNAKLHGNVYAIASSPLCIFLIIYVFVQSVNDAVPPIEPGTPAWKRTAEAGAPGWKRADQGAPGWKRAFNGVPGW